MTAAFWDRLVPELDGPSLAPNFPGRADRPADLMEVTVQGGADSVLADVAASELADADDLVVVGHSSAGLFIPSIVAGLGGPGGRVRHIVLSAASVPPEGGCGLDCMRPDHAAGLRSIFEKTVASGERLTTGGPPEDPEKLRQSYGERLDDDVLAEVAAAVVEDSVSIYFQPVHWSRAAGIPTTYVLNERDRPIPADLQEEMALRIEGVDLVRWDCGHIPSVTRPKEFADLVRFV
jgi:pimeloyl-ACP methyl ester carboxylesterase